MLSPIECSSVADEAVVPVELVVPVLLASAVEEPVALRLMEPAPMPELTSSSRALSASARLSNTAASVWLMMGFSCF